MGRVIDGSLEKRMDAIRDEIPKYWRDLALKMKPDADLECMRNVLRNRSHEEEYIILFERIVAKNRVLEDVI